MARKATKKQREFAREYVKTGNGTQSAIKAYNTDKPNTAKAIASENLTKPNVITLIEGFAEKAANRVQELAYQSDNLNVALTASRDMLDRAGFKPVEKNLTAIEGNLEIKWKD